MAYLRGRKHMRPSKARTGFHSRYESRSKRVGLDENEQKETVRRGRGKLACGTPVLCGDMPTTHGLPPRIFVPTPQSRSS